MTVLGKDVDAAEAVVADLGADGNARAGRSGDPIADAVAALAVIAVYDPDAQTAVEQYGDALSGKVVVDITNPVNDTFDGLVTPPVAYVARLRGTCSVGGHPCRSPRTRERNGDGVI